jgi:leader peptidase (prepilin peptidase)/N-methyltransferase
MKLLFTALPLPQTAALFFVVGACVGNLLMRWIVRLTPAGGEGGGSRIEDRGSKIEESPDPDSRPPIPDPRPPFSPWWTRLPVLGAVLARGNVCYRGESIGWRGLVCELVTGLVFAAFVVAVVGFRCQDLAPVVGPSDFWKYARIFYHLALIALLIAATATDLRDTVIPDQITYTGVAIGILGATLSGELQMMHLWIDWNVEIPGLKGPGFPPWIDAHRHLHGLCWSLAGIAAGAGITWLVRLTSRLILAQPALGLGDVTLMAMIGSYIGWQAVLFVLALAPLCGILVGLGARVFTGKGYVPFGPYLAAATLIVLFSWRWLWMLELPWAHGSISVRRLFGDWPSLAILGGAALAAMVLLLGLIRLYRAIPVERRGGDDARRPPGGG